MVFGGENTSYEDFKKFMQKPNLVCDNHKLGLSIDLKTALIHALHCKTRNCPTCYNFKKYRLFDEILKYVYVLGLNRHFIITFPGRYYRDRITWDQSYQWMNTRWDQFKLVIEYHYGKFDYIKLARAQQDGYCHFHLLINKYIPFKFLNEKRKNYQLGYNSIQQNTAIAEYLGKDYWNNDEWIIPPDVQNYSSSQTIKLQLYQKSTNLCVLPKKELTQDQIKQYMKFNYHIDPDFEQFNNDMKLQKDRRDYFTRWHNCYINLKKQGHTPDSAKALSDEIVGWCC